MAHQRRVVVTGVGIISPLGLTAKETWSNCLSGKSGISAVTRFDTSQYEARIAGEVKGFQPDQFIHKKEQKKMDLFIQYGMAAAAEAMQDSGFQITDENASKVGVVVSAGMGGLPGIETTYDTLRERGPGRVTPFFIPMVIANLASGQIAIKYGAKGPNLCVTSACSTGAHSIGEGMRYIQDGICDAVIAGGAESTICHLALAGFSSMKALSTRNDAPEKASRPWDKDRDGFVLGEGSGVLILEELESAQKRGARIYCELVGYGLNCDAYHMTNPSEGGIGASDCMNMALSRGKVSIDEIDYINAHGTSTSAGDIAETMAVKRTFGDRANKVWISSTKSMMGHLLGAAGAVEAALCVLSLRDNAVPPTINLDQPSPECDLDYVPHQAREKRLNAVLTNSFGFGGTNASLIFKRLS
ncbi:MAG: beta-ketoacyl-ACP synthase II [Oligoflexia bacterium]|nr:beta-ketoacyl-ACP synthase II [Oligoflexia bacterium]